MTDLEHEIPCPLPGCGEPLYLTWTACYALHPDDLRPLGNDERPVDSSDAHTRTWQVECTDGHVVLLPGDTGYPCPPELQGEEACPHTEDAYDWSEDTRTWREHDIARLRELLDQVTGLARCRECGCTDDRACVGGCWWVEPDLCSSCKQPAMT